MSDPFDFDDILADAEEVETEPDGRAIEETLLVGLLDPTLAPRILEATRPDDFHFDRHRQFATFVFPMAGEGRHVDRVTLRDAAKFVDDQETVDQLLNFADAVIAKASDDPPAPGQVLAYLDIFAANAKQRMAKEMVTQVGAKLGEMEISPESAAGEVLRIVADLEATRRLSGAGKTEGEELDAYFADLEAHQSRENDFQGLDTGFNHLNRVINGLTPGLIVLGASPSTGKTTFAKQIADKVVEKHGDAACLFVSLEQSKEELRVKTLSRLSGVENRDIQRGRLDPQSEGWKKIIEAKEEFKAWAGRMQVLEGDRLTTVDRIRLAALQLRQKTQAARLLIMVDYLQIVPTEESYHDIRQKVNFVTSELRRIGRDLDAPVLAIASVNRASYGNKGGAMDAYKESGDIEFSADVALVMTEDKDSKGDQNYLGSMRNWKKINLDVVKNRNGERARIELRFFPEVSVFTEVGKTGLPEG